MLDSTRAPGRQAVNAEATYMAHAQQQHDASVVSSASTLAVSSCMGSGSCHS